MQRGILLHAARRPGTPPRWSAALLEALPYAKRLELERREAEARAASLAGLGLAIAAVARVAPGGCRVAELRFPEGGKPRFVDGPGFSLSHSAGWVCAAAASSVELGADVEALPVGATDADRDRLSRWTAIEATLKAAGLGARHHAAVQLAPDRQSATLAGTRYLLEEWRTSGATGHLAAPGRLAFAIVSCDLDGAEVSGAVERALGLAPEREQ